MKNITRFVVPLVLLALLGCDSCYRHRLTSTTGEDSRRIMQSYVRTYGCPPFLEMETIDDMIAWCEQEGLGDSVSSDVVPGCRPGETLGGCERFWVCE